MELLTGLGLSPDSVKEGSDMFFECRVEANPHVYKITWLHEVGVVCVMCVVFVICVQLLLVQSGPVISSHFSGCARGNGVLV